jgi:D-alanyl-D-alanine carboxypeptidase (penicillin-binding protein 5/6)
MTTEDAALAVPPCEVARPAPSAGATSFLPVRASEVAEPNVMARTAVVVDQETGRVLWGKRAHARRAPASTTKMMTALLAVEETHGDEHVVASVDSREMIGSSLMGIVPGMEVSVRDLLFGLMLPSGNDAAIELARLVGGSESAFVDRMNERADELRLANTHFANPHGLDEAGHYSSAYDLAMIAREAMANDEFREVVAAPYYAIPWAQNWGMANGNSLLASYPGADGVKIGWTNSAGWTFVGSATRDGHRLIAVVLDTPDRDADAATLLDWGFSTYSWRPVGPNLLQELAETVRARPFGQSLVLGRACT